MIKFVCFLFADLKCLFVKMRPMYYIRQSLLHVQIDDAPAIEISYFQSAWTKRREGGGYNMRRRVCYPTPC